jgi:CrcB protein
MFMSNPIILVALGGALGAMARYGISLLPNQSNYPWQTFFINILGSFLIGFFLSLFKANSINQSMYLFLAVGLCGGFTTFSAFSAESLQLIQNNKILLFSLYSGLSVLLDILATFLGLKINPAK